MKVRIKENVMTIEADLTENKPSRSGNSTVIATTRGQQFVGHVNGKPTYLQLNVLQIEEATGGLELVTDEEQPGRKPPRAA